MHYRLYSLDAQTGAIMTGDDLIASDDTAAITQGLRTFPDPAAPFELWCGTRRVYRQAECASAPDRGTDRG